MSIIFAGIVAFLEIILSLFVIALIIIAMVPYLMISAFVCLIDKLGAKRKEIK